MKVFNNQLKDKIDNQPDCIDLKLRMCLFVKFYEFPNYLLSQFHNLCLLFAF
jgi:hypothetical protein